MRGAAAAALRCAAAALGSQVSLHPRLGPAAAVLRLRLFPSPPMLPAPAGAVPAQLITGTRLEGGPTAREGRLMVQVGGTWGAVANKNVSDIAAARAACRQLGYAGAAAARGAAYYGNSSAPAVLQILSCPAGLQHHHRPGGPGRHGGPAPNRPLGGLQECTLTRSLDPQDVSPADGFGVWCTGALRQWGVQQRRAARRLPPWRLVCLPAC